MKLLKWSLIAIVALVAGWTVWTIESVDVDVMPDNLGQVDARFFAGAPSAAPKPLLVAFGGAEGGNLWASERWAAERQAFLDEGYAMLAVGYFGAPGLPEHLDRIALEGIHDAIRAASARSEVDGRCVALVGASKGGELALLLASRYPDIDAVAAIVPGKAVFVGHTPAFTTSSFSHHGEQVPFVPLPWSATGALIAGDKRRVFELMVADTEAMARAAIPVEAINGPVFLLSATRDEFWDSSGMSDAMIERLDAKGFAYPREHLAIEGGHTEPTRHLDAVRGFLARHFKPRLAEGCSAPASLATR
jgi:dienelactone hydrolase